MTLRIWKNDDGQLEGKLSGYGTATHPRGYPYSYKRPTLHIYPGGGESRGNNNRQIEYAKAKKRPARVELMEKLGPGTHDVDYDEFLKL